MPRPMRLPGHQALKVRDAVKTAIEGLGSDWTEVRENPQVRRGIIRVGKSVLILASTPAGFPTVDAALQRQL